jgi:hypothetical protein
MIDVVQALELFEICADEMASEHKAGESNPGVAGRQRGTLTARALAKIQLHLDHMARYPLRSVLWGPQPEQSAMTLGAMIVFRTADKFVRAGAPPARTLDALYRAVQRYTEVLPNSLQDGVDQAAIRTLMTEENRASRGLNDERSSITGQYAGVAQITQVTAASSHNSAYNVIRLANP